MLLSTFLTTPVTISVGILSFRLNLDPDVIIYPVISTLADIIVSFCFLIAINGFIVFLKENPAICLLITLSLSVYPAYLAVNKFLIRDKSFIVNLKETIPLIIVLLFVSSITGSALSTLSEEIKNMPFLLTVFPAVIDSIGDIGAVIG